jgi:hypothetical protein
MGWWSKDIMGGDSPLDVKDEIYGICEVNEFEGEDGHNDLSKEHFAKNIDKILEFVRDQENNDYYDESAIAYQVLGVLMMKAGAPISPELKAEIIENSMTDTWAEQDADRREIVNGFHKALETYDGTPIIIRSRGLFEVMAEHIANGNTGLVNKGKDIG